MCLHRSYIVTEAGKVFSDPLSDHHTNIRAKHNIREEGFHHSEPHAAIECQPINDLFNVQDWSLVIDEERTPAWLKKSHKDKVIERLIEESKQFSNKWNRTYKFDGNCLDLRNLIGLYPETTIIANDIILDNVQYLPPKTTIICPNGIFIARSVRAIANDCHIVCRTADVRFDHPNLIRLYNMIRPEPRTATEIEQSLGSMSKLYSGAFQPYKALGGFKP